LAPRQALLGFACQSYNWRWICCQEWATKLMEFLPKAVIVSETEEEIKLSMPSNTDENVFPLKVCYL
jgi:hypothetical protein